MTRRTLFQRAAAAFAGTILARMPLAGARAEPTTPATPLTARVRDFVEAVRAVVDELGPFPVFLPYGVPWDSIEEVMPADEHHFGSPTALCRISFVEARHPYRAVSDHYAVQEREVAAGADLRAMIRARRYWAWHQLEQACLELEKQRPPEWLDDPEHVQFTHNYAAMTRQDWETMWRRAPSGTR